MVWLNSVSCERSALSSYAGLVMFLNDFKRKLSRRHDLFKIASIDKIKPEKTLHLKNAHRGRAGTETLVFSPPVATSDVGEAALTVWDELAELLVVAEPELPVSPPAVCVNPPELVGVVGVVKVVGVAEGNVWREVALSAQAGVLPVLPRGRFVLEVECGAELLRIVVPLPCMSHLLICELVGPKVAASAEENASRQHARVTKVVAMVLS